MRVTVWRLSNCKPETSLTLTTNNFLRQGERKTMTSRKFTQMFLALAALVVLSLSALAADPGITPTPAVNSVNDQRAGSVLIYNLYSSSSTNPAAENTRINITNTSDTSSVFVHLFFVDGKTCSVAD